MVRALSEDKTGFRAKLSGSRLSTSREIEVARYQQHYWVGGLGLCCLRLANRGKVQLVFYSHDTSTLIHPSTLRLLAKLPPC